MECSQRDLLLQKLADLWVKIEAISEQILAEKFMFAKFELEDQRHELLVQANAIDAELDAI